jgi:hypothetical protein
MIQNRIVCFRLDEQIDHRIFLVLDSRFSTRSRFIRTAIKKAVAGRGPNTASGSAGDNSVGLI